MRVSINLNWSILVKPVFSDDLIDTGKDESLQVREVVDGHEVRSGVCLLLGGVEMLEELGGDDLDDLVVVAGEGRQLQFSCEVEWVESGSKDFLLEDGIVVKHLN